MPSYKAPVDDVTFLLSDVFHLDRYNNLPGFAEATPDLIGKLKHGQMLTIQAINLAGSAISFQLPLVDFAKANEGPPTDPKVFAAQQKKSPDEMQKRAEEARKKLKSQGTASASTR